MDITNLMSTTPPFRALSNLPTPRLHWRTWLEWENARLNHTKSERILSILQHRGQISKTSDVFGSSVKLTTNGVVVRALYDRMLEWYTVDSNFPGLHPAQETLIEARPRVTRTKTITTTIRR